MKTPAPKTLLALATLLLPALALRAQTATAINWSVNGNHTGTLMNGVNYSRGMSYAHGDSTYIGQLWYLNPRLVRLHTTWQTNNWLVPDGSGGYSWNATLINTTMDNLEDGPPATWIMTINRWPDAWADGGGKLLPARYDDYADLCAELVTLLAPRNIVYWECFNEKEGLYTVAQTGDYCEIFARCVDAMTAADPDVRVGPAWYLPYDTARLNAFLGDSRVQSRLRVWTYHHYATGSATITNDEILTRPLDIADKAQGMRNLLDSHGYADVPNLLTETNIFWAWDLDTSLRMRGEIGACFLALTYKRIVERNVLDGVCSWNDADGHYGKMSLSFAMYPSGHVMALINEHLVGTRVSSSSASNSTVSVLAIKDGSKRAFLLVNPTASTQSINMNFNGWTYSGTWTRHVVTSTGLATSSHTWSGLNPGTLGLAPYSVQVCVFP